MGSSTPENPNEALYQAGFYCYLNDATSGSVHVSPEFVLAKYSCCRSDQIFHSTIPIGN
jgi:hypothetical protein